MNIIGVSGKAGSGKDTFCDIAVNEFGAVKVSFAGGLKEEVGYFLSACGVRFRRENLYGTQSDKEETFSIPQMMWIGSFPAFKDFVDKYGDKDPYFHDNIISTFRKLLQWWGTEFRRSQDDQYWVKRCISKCTEDKLYVISDCRFKNEAEAVLKVGGELVRIERPNGIDISNMDHASEIDLDDWDAWSFQIENIGSLKEYEKKCRCILREIVNGKI